MMSNENRLIWAIAVTFIVLVGEVVGGYLSNSLALLSDAAHVLTDVFALGISLIAAYISKRPSDYRATYGYQRIGILAALINGCSLVVISVFIFIETYHRIFEPPQVNPDVMLYVAIGGLIGNIIMARILGHGHKDLNVKSAWLHVIGDMITSAGVIIAGVVIKFTGWHLADPIASGIVGVIIIIGGTRVIKESLWIFLELSPLGYHAEDVSSIICDTKDVLDVHDVHIWSIGHGVPAFSAHVLCNDMLISQTDAIRKEIEDKLAHLGFRHTVIQMESVQCKANGLYCEVSGPGDEHSHHHH
jgi:cobalt-zinc-cadmium efflux system protein